MRKVVRLTIAVFLLTCVMSASATAFDGGGGPPPQCPSPPCIPDGGIV